MKKKMNPLLLIFLRALGGGIIVIPLVAALIPSYLNQACRAKQTGFEGRYWIAMLNRSQQEYFIENGKFATSISDLLSISRSTSPPQNYQYEVKSIDDTFVVNSAVAKNGLKIYVGLVWLEENVTNKKVEPQALLCESKDPTKILPTVLPSIHKQCPEKFQAIGKS